MLELGKLKHYFLLIPKGHSSWYHQQTMVALWKIEVPSSGNTEGYNVIELDCPVRWAAYSDLSWTLHVDRKNTLQREVLRFLHILQLEENSSGFMCITVSLSLWVCLWAHVYTYPNWKHWQKGECMGFLVMSFSNVPWSNCLLLD